MIEVNIKRRQRAKNLAKQDIKENPKFKALVMLSDEFYKHKIPLKHLGKIKIDVDESFFQHEETCKEIIQNFGIAISNIYKAMQEEFGDNAEDIFPTMIENCIILEYKSKGINFNKTSFEYPKNTQQEI